MVSVQVRQDGNWIPAQATHVRVNGEWVPITGLSRKSEDVVPPVNPLVRRLGIYNGAPNENPDTKTVNQFGSLPEIASTYYINTQTSLNIAFETGRINNGISPLITMTAKDTNRITEIAAGNAGAIAWMQSYVNSLKTLSEVNPNVPVYASFDHEWEVKVNQGILTGGNANVDNYAKALAKFFELCQATAPLVQFGYWYGHFDTAKISAVLNALTTHVTILPKFISLDPYQNGQGGSTAVANWEAKLAWLRSRPAYTALGSPPIGIAEFGMGKGNNGFALHTDAQLATFYSYLHAQMESADVIFALFFQRDKATEPGYIIADGNHPLAVAAFADSLAGS